jgi:hypothetical protein
MTHEAKKVVWILGAGFSRSLGAPLLGQMLTSPAVYRSRKLYPKIFPETECQDLVVSAIYEAGSSTSARTFEAQWEHAEEFLERLDLAAVDKSEEENLRAFINRVVIDWNRKRGSDPLIGMMYNVAIAMRDDPVPLTNFCEVAWKMLAAECCCFLHGLDHKTARERERWMPYFRWAERLTPNDTVITFNYDRVPNILESTGKFWIPAPGDLTPSLTNPDGSAKPTPTTPDKALVLKLHGSVDWIRDSSGRVVRAETDSLHRGHATEAAVHCMAHQLATAVPGPSKRKSVESTGPVTSTMSSEHPDLNWVWQPAYQAIEKADAIVFVGYRIPPTDAFTREKLVEYLMKNPKRLNGFNKCNRVGNRIPLAAEGLPVYTILGDDVNHKDSRRLQGLLDAVGGIDVRQMPLFAEDFLAVFERDELFRTRSL